MEFHRVDKAFHGATPTSPRASAKKITRRFTERTWSSTELPPQLSASLCVTSVRLREKNNTAFHGEDTEFHGATPPTLRETPRYLRETPRYVCEPPRNKITRSSTELHPPWLKSKIRRSQSRNPEQALRGFASSIPLFFLPICFGIPFLSEPKFLARF